MTTTENEDMETWPFGLIVRNVFKPVDDTGRRRVRWPEFAWFGPAAAIMVFLSMTGRDTMPVDVLMLLSAVFVGIALLLAVWVHHSAVAGRHYPVLATDGRTLNMIGRMEAKSWWTVISGVVFTGWMAVAVPGQDAACCQGWVF